MERVGSYEIVRQLGIGGAAVVHLARDTRSGAPVALKLLHEHLLTDRQHVQRFQQEAAWVSKIRHPNVVRLLEYGEADGRLFMANEYIEGSALREQLLCEFPLLRVVEIASGVARGLSAAHAEWIVHRDIKPENVLLGQSGEVKVVDFGLAKLTQPTARPLTRPGFIIGTLTYLTPEQLMGNGVDPRTDLFNLGELIYEMVTCHPPFDGSSTRNIIDAILREDPPPMKRERVEIPGSLASLVSRLLEKDPDDRPQSAEEVVKMLDGVAAELEQGETTLTRRYTDS